MGTLQRSQMNTEVAAIIDDTSRTSQINTRLQWATDKIAGWHQWRALGDYEDRTTTLKAFAVTGITQANPAVVTIASHTYSNGDLVIVQGVSGMTEVNNRVYTVANQAASTIELSGVDSSAYAAYGSGGTVALYDYARPSALRTIATIRYIRSDGGKGWMLEKKDEEAFNDEFAQSTAQGAPVAWCFNGGKVKFDRYPTASEHGDSLFMTGAAWPTDYAGDTSVSDLPDGCDEAIIYLASSMMYLILEEEQLAKYYETMARQVAADAFAAEEAFGPP